MKASYKRLFLAAMLTASAGTMMAQEFNSAYFLDDFKYRHTMNAAFGNDQNYVAIPVLGNTNFRLQGNLGVGDLLWANPDFGKKADAKKTTTFMHPGIGVDEALANFDKDGSKLLFDIDLDIVSVGFKAFGGYNTVELKERTSLGLMLPYEFFEFAKDTKNKDYSLNNLGLRGQSYAELAFGHSRQLMDNLRVGAKVKVLLGVARGELTVDNMHAKLEGDQWELEGIAKAELNMKGASFTSKDKEYESRPGKYTHIDDIDIDGAGISGFGLGLDLGAVYEFKDLGIDALNGLKVSAALNDLGFISWSNSVVAQNNGKKFTFKGFQNMGVTEGDNTFDDQLDNLRDDLTDFIHLTDQGDEGGKTTGLAATAKLGVEYPLPVYDKVTFGLLGTHRFAGDYSWTEGRLSANYKPLSWLDGGINVAVTNFCTTMGWVVNFHPVGMNVFFGMDHMYSKAGASMIPLTSNVSFNFGLNVAW